MTQSTESHFRNIKTASIHRPHNTHVHTHTHTIIYILIHTQSYATLIYNYVYAYTHTTFATDIHIYSYIYMHIHTQNTDSEIDVQNISGDSQYSKDELFNDRSAELNLNLSSRFQVRFVKATVL